MDEKTQKRIGFLPLFPDNPYQARLIEALGRLGYLVQETPYRGLLRQVFFSSNKPDILHVHWLNPLFLNRSFFKTFYNTFRLIFKLILLRMSGIKIVWTLHNLTSHESHHARLDAFCHRHAARCAHAIITHGRAAKSLAVSKLNIRNARKVSVIEHAHYIDCYPNQMEKRAARKQLAIEDSQFVFLFLGEIRPYKGVPELIAAAKQLSREADNWQLIIAGRPMNNDVEQDIRAKTSEIKQIRFYPGFVGDDDLQLYLNAADAVVFPYQRVFTSGSIILAMSFGRACVAPALDCIMDVLDEEGACLYPPEGQEGLADAFRRAMHSKEDLERMGCYNLQKASQWGWDTMAEKTAEIYRELV